MFNNVKNFTEGFIVFLMVFSLINPNTSFAEEDLFIHDEVSFRNAFPDPVFANIVLKALRQDPGSVVWYDINCTLGSITSLNLEGDITSLDGLERLTGLEVLSVDGTNIDKFPSGIENDLKYLIRLRVYGNQKPLTIPKFASLKELTCTFGQAISIDSKESIEGMSNLEDLHFTDSDSANAQNSLASKLDYTKLSL